MEHFTISDAQTPASPPTDPRTTPFALSVVTVAKGQGHATKKIIPDAQGRPIKDPQRGLWIASGALERVEVAGLEGLRTFLHDVTKQQALVHGVPKDPTQARWTLVTAEHFTGEPGTITRTLEHLEWPAGPHLLLFDYDPDPQAQTPVQSAEALIARLGAVWPAFGEAAYLITTSTSSGIQHKTTREWLVPPRGMHLYPLVTGDVTRFREALTVRLWLAGEGFCKLAKPNAHTGVAAVLERALVDLTVFSPERLDYVAGAEIARDAPFVQVRDTPVLRPGGLLDLDAFPALTDDERRAYAALLAEAKARLTPERHATIRARIRQQHPTLEAAAVETKLANRLAYAERGELDADHPLYFARTACTAGTVTKKQDGQRLRDPQEPDYGPSQAVFHWREGDWRIVSFAHGVKKVYRRAGAPQATAVDAVVMGVGDAGETPDLEPDAPGSPPVWHQKLNRTPKGEIQADLGNYGLILTHHPHWQGRLTFDTFRHEPCLDGKPFTPYTGTAVARWLCTELHMSITQRNPVLQVMAEVASQHPFDPLKDHLRALPSWDGTERRATWLVRYFGAKDTLYTRWAGTAFLCGLLSRALVPGGIMRLCLILEGPEGNKKSAAVEVLGGPFASAMSASLEGKESQMRLKGVWVMELPELDALSRSEETRIKAFLSLTSDDYIPKYEGSPVSYKRRTVFIGTTNEREYLKGLHGNTRYLPMRTGTLQVEGLARDRDQLLAEGLRHLETQPQWWEVPDAVQPLLDQERAKRKKVPVFREPLLDWLEKPDIAVRNHFTMQDVLEKALGVQDMEKWPRLQQPVGEALRDLGWIPTIEWDGTEGKSKRYWVREEAEDL
jgi:hypothetical protein